MRAYAYMEIFIERHYSSAILGVIHQDSQSQETQEYLQLFKSFEIIFLMALLSFLQTFILEPRPSPEITLTRAKNLIASFIDIFFCFTCRAKFHKFLHSGIQTFYFYASLVQIANGV